MKVGFRHTMLLGLSSSVTGGLAYSYIISLDPSYFAPALGIVAGLLGSMGIATESIFSSKNVCNDIPLSKLATHIVFGIMALVFGYILVFYFVQLPNPALHDALLRPVDQGTLDVFLMQTMGIPDILGAILGALCSAAIPMIFKEKIMVLIEKLKFNQFH